METEIKKMYEKIYKPKNIELIGITKQPDKDIYEKETKSLIKTIKGQYIVHFKNVNDGNFFVGNFHEGQNLEEAFIDLIKEEKIT